MWQFLHKLEKKKTQSRKLLSLKNSTINGNYLVQYQHSDKSVLLLLLPRHSRRHSGLEIKQHLLQKLWVLRDKNLTLISNDTMNLRWYEPYVDWLEVLGLFSIYYATLFYVHCKDPSNQPLKFLENIFVFSVGTWFISEDRYFKLSTLLRGICLQ